MINNRQAGRRRGRGGGGNNGGGNQGGQRQGRADNGNRIDNRARGNAVQLLEKYKNLAADAQRQGDRVNTEYYLQFADHYFRVIADQRGRFEDQQPRRQQGDFDNDGDDDFAEEGEPIRAGEQQMEVRQDRADRQDRPDRQERGDRPVRDRGDRDRQADRQPDRDRQPERFERRPRRDEQQHAGPRDSEVGGQHRADVIEPGEPLAARAEQVIEADAPLAAPPRRRGRPPRAAAPEGAEAAPGLDADRLPPSLMMPANDAGGDDAPKPRRRGRPPRVATEAPAAE